MVRAFCLVRRVVQSDVEVSLSLCKLFLVGLCKLLGNIALRICKILAVSLAMSLPTPTVAQFDSGAWERLQALSETDPELYRLIMLMMTAKDRHVNGGFDWEATSADLECTEGFNGGFSECEVTVSIQGESFAASEDRRSASLEIECDVELRTENEDGFSSTETESDTGELAFYSSSRASTELSVAFSFIGVSRIASAVIRDVSCELQGVR